MSSQWPKRGRGHAFFTGLGHRFMSEKENLDYGGRKHEMCRLGKKKDELPESLSGSISAGSIPVTPLDDGAQGSGTTLKAVLAHETKINK